MEILESRTLEGRIHEIELSGVLLTFHGNKAAIISNQSGNGFNVAIGYGIGRTNPGEIKPENYVLHTMARREIVEEIYNNLI